MNKIPCPPDCPKRTIRCHSTCKEYKMYVEEREYIRQQRAKDNITIGYENDTKRRLYGKKFD